MSIEERIAREEAAALRAAVLHLVKQAEFRRLIRTWLSRTGALENGGMGVNPFAANALTTAHETGKMAAIQDFVGQLISTFHPDFLPTILKEENDVRRSNARRIADSERGRDSPADAEPGADDSTDG